jgi:hypothetical protein
VNLQKLAHTLPGFAFRACATGPLLMMAVNITESGGEASGDVVDAADTGEAVGLQPVGVNKPVKKHGKKRNTVGP